MKYRALSRTFVDNKLVETGGEFEYDGPKSSQWEALEPAATETKGRRQPRGPDSKNDEPLV